MPELFRLGGNSTVPLDNLRMRILISDDSRFSAVVLTKTLEKHGHDVAVAHNGVEAWAHLQNEDVSLVITDWLMPEMDGLELCRRIRTRHKASYTYVILLTTKGQQSDRLEALRAGIDDFLVKPLDEPELLARLDVAQRILKMQDQLTIRAAQLKEQNAQLAEAAIYLEMANHRYTQLFAGLPVACFAYDEEGRIQDWNRACEQVFGRSAGQVLQQTVWSMFGDPYECERMKEMTAQVFGGAGVEGLEQSIVRPDGAVRHILTNSFPLRGGNGEIVGAISASLDITERKSKEEALARSEEQYRTLAHNFPNGAIMLFDSELRYTIAEGAGLAPLGLFKEKLIGRPLWDVFSPDICALLSPHYRGALTGAENVLEMTHGERSYLVRTLPVRNVLGDIFAGMSIVQDITDQKRYEQLIEDQMTQSHRAIVDLERQRDELEQANSRLTMLITTDSVTGLLNAHAFQDRLVQEFDSAMSALGSVSVILLDLDRFQTYRIENGDQAGDTTLRTVAKRLQENVRICDFVARNGDDEFAVLLPDTDKDGALWMAERIRHAIAEEPVLAGIAVSLGLSSLRPDTHNAAQLITEAVHALSVSKQCGGARPIHATDIDMSQLSHACA